MKQVKTKVEPKPPWLKIKPPGGDKYLEIKALMRKHNLYTVCEEARCPNVSECWGGGTATIMLLGDTCTRHCKFCHVKTGNPRGKVDELEPEKVGQTIGQLGLTYVVLTSVDRDDLPDGGADHFGRTVENIKKLDRKVLVEVLVPDFKGDEKAVERLVESGADVLAHNLETVERLTPKVRDPRAPYEQSLRVLSAFKKHGAKYTKSSLMVGLGETQEEISQAMDDLRSAGVDIITLGQYLQPSPKHLKVAAYIHPEQFKEYEIMAKEKGFLYVASGALVRSSYRAGELFLEGLLRKKSDH